MTLTEAQRIHDAHQTRKGKPTPTEYMRYMWAKKLLADAGRIVLSAAQRGFIVAAHFPEGITGGDARAHLPAAEFPDPNHAEAA